MKLRWLFVLAIVLTLLGTYFTVSAFAWAAMAGHTCEGYWDVPNCQALLRNTFLSIAAPGPGLALLIIAVRRFIILLRGPTPDPPRDQAAPQIVGKYR